jgi:IrrE N-terminal-like domain
VRTPPRRFLLATLAGFGLWPIAARGQELHLLPGIAEVENDDIHDVAVAAVDQPVPVIYYNPRYARRYGPEVTRFLMAHEYGHIYYHHTRAGLSNLPDATRDSLLQAQELQADCFAAGQPGLEARKAAEAAIRFFTRLGPFRFDNQHPTGAQRVSRILACLPAGPALALDQGDTGIETGPVSGEPERIRFRVTTPGIAEAAYGSDVVLWVDGREVGRLSNMRFPRELALDRFSAGMHSYRMSVDLYQTDELQQLIAAGHVSGQGHFVVKDGDAFTVSWRPGDYPSLIPAPGAAPGPNR